MKIIIHKTNGKRIAVWTKTKCGEVLTSERISTIWSKVTCKKCLKELEKNK